jgi:hypothetical protein
MYFSSVHLIRYCPLVLLLLVTMASHATAQHDPPVVTSEAVVPHDVSHFDGMCPTCVEPTCCCGPKWTFSAGTVVLSRSDPDGDPLYQDNIDPLVGSDFDLGWQAGYEFQLTRHNVTGGDAITARVLVVDGWSAQASALIPGATQINTDPLIPMVGPRAVGADLASQLISYEVNYVWDCYWHPAVSWLVGFRSLEIDETLNAQLVYPPTGFPTVYHAVGTQNRLYGVQAGSDVRLYDQSNFRLGGLLRVGVYGNAANHQSAAWDDATLPIYANGSDSTASFVGETGLSGSYHLSDCMAVRVDYRVLWVTGLALAPEQVPVTNFTLGNGIDNDATAFYHGVFVGFDWSF